MKACKLTIPSSSEVSSLLFDPISHSTALTLTNSSTLLFPSLPIFSQPQPQIQIPPLPIPLPSPPPASSTSAPAAPPPASHSSLQGRAELSAGQRDLVCDGELGLVFDGAHGVSCELKGSVNVFVMYSVSARKIWVFAARVVGRMMRRMELGVFPLRLIVKGEVRDKRDCKLKKSQGCGSKCEALGDRPRLQNGFLESVCESKSTTVYGTAKVCSNGTAETIGGNSSGAKRTVRSKQDSSICGSIFVPFNALQDQSQTSKSHFFSLKAISIHPLSEKMFVVLDSAGDLHLLNLYNTFPGSEISGKMRHLKSTMKVQMLAVFPDLPSIVETQTLWISDGFYSVHNLPITELEIPLDEEDKSENEEKRMQNSDVITAVLELRIL
ncbi:hypothetical protein Scep_016616 [Stephania cephalantha]|uniref:Uncharacterized protein n=1 Tax=Stephania cephalantha TaxID=152367 RepID=A0AAP0NTF4_9MAGN